MIWSRRRDRSLRPDDPLVYELAELRRQQFDGMIWQVPVITFAGQAFVFSVLLGSGTAAWARIFAGVFSVGLSYLSLLLLARHRQADEATGQWLAQYELAHGWTVEEQQHGTAWVNRRNSVLPGPPAPTEPPHPGRKRRRTGWGRVPLLNGYKTWVVALYALMVFAAIATILGALTDFHVIDLQPF